MIDTLIEKYIKLRDKKAEMKASFDASVASVDAYMKKCEQAIMQHLDKNGVDSVGSASGTAFKSTTTSATVADKEAFLSFVRTNDAWPLMDVRASKTAVVEYVEAHDDLPPGINWRAETVVRIRRT
jgi:hypothetical protein